MRISLPQAHVPSKIPEQRWRQPQSNVPPTREMRERIKQVMHQGTQELSVVPPVPLDDLRSHAEQILEANGIDTKFTEYSAVLVNNELWRDHLASVPYHRRLLLLPKCLRKEETCPAPFDEFGLLCKQCGQCSLQELQAEAERLGYAVLIAEGSPIVMRIIETGKIDAIVGVSCLSVLERAFPYMESAAIPGVAIPLLQDDCKDTNVDLEWIWDVIHLTSADKTFRMDLDSLRSEVESWFSDEKLDEILGPCGSETERVARDWLSKSGKRWRPFLSACAYRAIKEDTEAGLPDGLRKLAVAVECFHKASLVHDDIEDDDAIRYEDATVHADHGVPVALNVGDLLLGEGYRLIGEVDAPAQSVAEMLRVAAIGHRDLCLGQGTELSWHRNPSALKSKQVLEIFRRKTAPAFEVALRLGALYADVDGQTHEVLQKYSENLGIAYQIRDDLDDWFGDGDGEADAEAMRPTLIPALAHERMRDHDDKQTIESLWLSQKPLNGDTEKLREIFRKGEVNDRAKQLLDAYKEEAIRSLRTLENPTLKGLLRRVVTKIFNDVEIRGWCSEHQASSASGGEARAESAA